jgi:glucosylceramidase
VVTIDERTHSAALGLSYYQTGQVSAFVQPGARRIASPHFISYAYTGSGKPWAGGLDDVAFRNPDGSHVLIAYNNYSAPVPFAVEWQGRWLTYKLPRKATVTLIWSRPRMPGPTSGRREPLRRGWLSG